MRLYVFLLVTTFLSIGLEAATVKKVNQNKLVLEITKDEADRLEEGVLTVQKQLMKWLLSK